MFTYDSGSGEFTRNGNSISFTGTHPIVYAAKGSHGLWRSSGDHTYETLVYNGEDLEDECSEGTAWNTWNNVNVIPYESDYNDYSVDSHTFLKFEGRWGNEKSGCGSFGILEEISGECQLNDGPRGPQKKID